MKVNPSIGKKCRNGCGEILEDRRQALFQFFWNLQNQQRRKDWIAQMTVQKPVKKYTINTANTSRRGVTYEYYINDMIILMGKKAKAKLPISVQKYNDLKKLIDNKVIPSHCAKEYLDLKFNKKTIDCLPDTDEEE
ncbi:hypothetical protein ACJJTC_009746 [Scirpophaga incertulas]